MNNSIQTIREILTKNYFSYLFYALVLFGIYPLILWEKADMNILVNDNIANYTLDPVFIVYSQAFEGWLFLGIIVVMLFISKQKTLMFIFSGLLCGVITMILKDHIFGNVPRPTMFLPLDSYSHILQDISIYKEYFSFPSGHTMTAFATMTLFASFTRRKWVQIVCFVIAFGAGFSRIYLLQHFFIDTYVGAIVGFCISVLICYLCTSVFSISDTPLIRRNLKKND